jgi:hypothetical protein
MVREREAKADVGDLRPGVPELDKQAAAAMGGKFLSPTPRDERAMDGEEADDDAGA